MAKTQFSRISGRLAAAAMVALMMAGWADHARAEVTRESDLRTLQTERIETLEELLKHSQSRHVEGAGCDLAEVIEVLGELRKAKLDAAQAPAERRKALEELRDAWKRLEALVTERVKKGKAPLNDQLRVRAGRLEIEIMLARLKQALSGEGRD